VATPAIHHRRRHRDGPALDLLLSSAASAEHAHRCQLLPQRLGPERDCQQR
jgi:hypothetical protein